MPVIVYSVLRLGLFALALLGLWAAGMGGWLPSGSPSAARPPVRASHRGWRPTPRPRTPRRSSHPLTRVRARARGPAARRRRAPAGLCRPRPGPAGCPARRPAPCRPAPRPGPGAAPPGAPPVPRWRTPHRRGSPGQAARRTPGGRGARRVYAWQLALAILAGAVCAIEAPGSLLVLLLLVPVGVLAGTVLVGARGILLGPVLAGTGLLELAYGVLLGLGLAL